MPNNKNYSARERVIDRCLQDPEGVRSVDLLKEVNAVLKQMGLPTVCLSTVQADVAHIGLMDGAELAQVREGREIRHRYADGEFSLYRINLSDEELRALHTVLGVLDRVQHMPGFEWVTEQVTHLQHSFFFRHDSESVIHFQNAEGYTGYRFLSVIYSAIIEKKALVLSHQKFGDIERRHLLHPYLLVQYDMRWYVIGRLEGELFLRTFGLDRVTGVADADIPYVPNNGAVDYDRDFAHIIGVSSFDNPHPVDIRLYVAPCEVNYLRTCPLHSSQVMIACGDHAEVTLHMTVNYELKQRLLHYSEWVFVMEPKSLRDEMYRMHRTQCEFCRAMG